MLNNLRQTIVALCLMPLLGCSLGNFVAGESIDYNATVEDVTDDLLVTNILRARDQAPLIFSDLSQIRGSIQLNLTAQDTFPWGPWFRPPTGTGVRRSEQVGPITLQNNPTFDIAPLNTKQFSQGILEPLSSNILIYYINRGVPANPMLHLLVYQIDEVTVNGKTVTVKAIHHYYDPFYSQEKDRFFREAINQWVPPPTYPADPSAHQIKIVTSDEPENYGPVVVTDAKGLASAAAAGLEAKAKGNKVQFTKKGVRTTICVLNRSNVYVPVIVSANSVTKAPKAEQIPKLDSCDPAQRKGASKNVSAPPFDTYQIHIRSVQSVFYYLGYIVDHSGEAGFISPLPWFRIPNVPIGRLRFSVSYQGQKYYVGEISGEDETLQILAILNDLLNLNRDANEIPTTKAVQAVGSGS